MRSSEITRPEPILAMVTRPRAWEGREINVAPEVPREPEIEMRPEPEISTCEGSSGATGSYPTDTALFIFAEIVTAHVSQEVTETGFFSTEVPSRTFPSHTGSQPGIISAGTSATAADISRAEISPPQLCCYDVPIVGSFAHAHAPIRDTTVLPLSASAPVAPVKEIEGTVDIPQPRVDPAPLVTEPYCSIDAWHDIQAWRQAYVHAQHWQSEDLPQVTVHSWGMSHARPWEESSELVVHTTFATPTAAAITFFTRDTVARDLGTLVPSVSPSVLPQVSETADVRPTARLVDRPQFVQRSRSRTPDRSPRSPRLRRPLDIATSGYTVYTARAQLPPPAPPPSPMPGMSQYLGSDNESLSSDSTPPPAEREPPP